MREPQDTAALRRMFASGPGPGLSQRPEGGVDADRIWQFLTGELDEEERAKLAEELARNPELAEAHRIGLDLWREAGEPWLGGEPAADEPARRGRFPRWGQAVAAAIVVALGVTFLLQREAEEPVYRAPETARIESLLVEGAPVPRSEVVLRWRALDRPAEYSVRVLTRDLRLLAEEFVSQDTEYSLDPTRLEGLSSGDRLFWQVTARLEDGVELESDTFVLQLSD